MSNDQLNTLFEMARKSPVSTTTENVAGWIDANPSVVDPRLKIQLKHWILFIAGLSIIVLPILLLNSNHKKKEIEDKKFTKNIEVLPKVEQISENSYNDAQAPISSAKSYDQKSNIESKLLQEVQLESIYLPTKTPQPISYISQIDILEKLDLLAIFDSTWEYNTPKRFQLDEEDCYFQIYNDYAVVSYRFRGSKYFYSGQIHRKEKVVLDGNEYTGIVFQQDNRYVNENQGKRVFLGYRNIGNGSFEIVQFYKAWSPARIFNAHNASENEIQLLKERASGKL